jgi:hypothetical protein
MTKRPKQQMLRTMSKVQMEMLFAFSASAYRRFKNISIETVIIAELKLRNVERHVFSTHLVERADHAALEDRPETFNRVGVNPSDNILLPRPPNQPFPTSEISLPSR